MKWALFWSKQEGIQLNEREVIRRLTEHLKYKKITNGYLCAKDKNFSITYVEDFLCLTRSQAREFLKENVPAIAGLL